MHPVLAEIYRLKTPDNIRPSVLRRWQREIRDDIQPLLDRLEALEAQAARARDGKESADGVSH